MYLSKDTQKIPRRYLRTSEGVAGCLGSLTPYRIDPAIGEISKEKPGENHLAVGQNLLGTFWEDYHL